MKERLRKFIEDSGMTQDELARKVGVDPTAVSHWMSGNRKPGRTRLKKLSKVTSIPLGDLL